MIFNIIAVWFLLSYIYMFIPGLIFDLSFIDDYRYCDKYSDIPDAIFMLMLIILIPHYLSKELNTNIIGTILLYLILVPIQIPQAIFKSLLFFIGFLLKIIFTKTLTKENK